jgi:hypothetical protein
MRQPSVRILRATDGEGLLNFAIRVVSNYLMICYPNQVGLAPVIASDLIDTRDDWRPEDFICCFKFMRQRQDIEALRVVGNNITLPKVMELVSIYEGERAAARENMNKNSYTTDKTAAPVMGVAHKFSGKMPEGSAVLGKEYEQRLAAYEEHGRPQRSTAVPDERWFMGK